MEIGVIIGRFQTPFLHEAHINLIESVIRKHKKVIILLGVSVLRGTFRDPLDFQTRALMIRDRFPEAIISHVTDNRSNEAWSKNVDNVIDTLKSPIDSPILYGSRDSFIPYYSGKYPTKELDSDVVMSATSLREAALQNVKNSNDFRAGVIVGASTRYPTVFTTVDVAIFNGDKILLGRKKNEEKFRFIGGFADVNSNSFEEDAIREVAEETTLSIDGLTYVGSYAIDDWRYRKVSDKIRTIFFKGTYQFGRAEPKDDIAEVKWFEFTKLTEDDIIPEHIILFKALTR